MNKLIYYIISFILTLSFFKGVFYILGIDITYVQLLIEVSILVFFLISLLYVSRKRKLIFYGIFVSFVLFLITIISYLFNDTSFFQLLLFYRAFMYYLFFFALLNVKLAQVYRDKIVKLIIILFFIQIPAAFIKLFLIGTEEYFIGTIAYLGGDIATIMPLMAISYLVANYLILKKKIYIVFIFLFISISLISNKLGIIFYVGILFVLLSYIYSLQTAKSLINILFLQKMLAIFIIFSVIFVAYVKLNPRANPERMVGGSVDIEYLIKYSEQYNTAQLDSRVEGDGRFDAPFVALNRLYYGGVFNTLFGFGPGDIVQSSYTKYDKPLLEKYNIGYGGRLGVVWTLMQIGIVGTIFFILFHILLFKKLINKFYKKKLIENEKILLLTTIGFSIIYFMDYFTYGAVLIKVPAMVLTYFFMIYYILNYNLVAKRDEEIKCLVY